eukprot:5313835-Pleurochrysis_carterae.AAC.3
MQILGFKPRANTVVMERALLAMPVSSKACVPRRVCTAGTDQAHLAGTGALTCACLLSMSTAEFVRFCIACAQTIGSHGWRAGQPIGVLQARAAAKLKSTASGGGGMNRLQR